MPSKYWIKLYHEVLDDPKMGRLPDRLWRLFIELNLIAGINNKKGVLPRASEIAKILNRDLFILYDDLNSLYVHRFISYGYDGPFVIGFAAQQDAHPAHNTFVVDIKLRNNVFTRDHYKCVYCFEDAEHIDHIHPRSKGGSDTYQNLVAACTHCNISKGANEWIAWYRKQPFFNANQAAYILAVQDGIITSPKDSIQFTLAVVEEYKCLNGENYT